MDIGGNIFALLQVKGKGTKNSIGAYESEWIDGVSILGWLDLSTGDSKNTSFNAKIQESTHYFLCDYLDMKAVPVGDSDETVEITSENSRLVIDGVVYEILLIDDPMNMHEHLEIYLRYIGGQ